MIAVGAAVALFGALAAPRASPPPLGHISAAEGTVLIKHAVGDIAGTFVLTGPGAIGATVEPGDILETQDRSRVEIEFPDRSVLRLGPGAKLELVEAHFAGARAARKLTARLLLGKLWAKVTSALHGEDRFHVETENAVAGVRGTTFRVDANRDKSVLVRVYDGEVAVAKNAPRPEESGERREVEGPQEVTREQWEKLVGRQMQIRISADGTPGEPEPFSRDEERDDAFVRWNLQRDEAPR